MIRLVQFDTWSLIIRLEDYVTMQQSRTRITGNLMHQVSEAPFRGILSGFVARPIISPAGLGNRDPDAEGEFLIDIGHRDRKNAPDEAVRLPAVVRDLAKVGVFPRSPLLEPAELVPLHRDIECQARQPLKLFPAAGARPNLLDAARHWGSGRAGAGLGQRFEVGWLELDRFTAAAG